jgi:hypothetical protein
MVYRPEDEDRLDVEASIEFRIPQAAPDYPQIFVRAQRPTIENPNEYDGYLIFVAGDASLARIGRQRGDVYLVTLEDLPISPPLETGSTYRLTLSAVGTDPVVISGQVELKVGNNWTVIASATHMDAALERVATPGAVGFGAHDLASPIYDRFRWQALQP